MRVKSLKNGWPVAGGVATLILASVPSLALDLKPETVDRWTDYVRTIDTRTPQRLVSGRSFLASDEISGQAAALRGGRIIVSPADPHVPLAAPSGLIHHWIGAVFIPDATLNSVSSAIRDYDRYEEVYRPNVADVKLISTTETTDRYSMVLMNRSVVSKTALDTEYITSYTRADNHRFYSITDSIRVQEIAQYGTTAQHTMPGGHGTGLVWRLHTVARYEERDGGVYLEVEALALSRDIPSALRWIVEPIVRRVSKSSLTNSLSQTQAALRARAPVVITTRR